MRRLGFTVIVLMVGLAIGPAVQLAAQPVERDPLVLQPGEIQPIECTTGLAGTLDRVECRELPVAAETCPAWLHDQWTATGPDGEEYPTWHPPIDPEYGCYYRHEHGVDPSYFHPNYQALYGYTAAQHGMNEPHAGFKTYVWDGPNGVRWLVTQHFGTSGLGRACTRYHTFDVAAVDIATNEIVADLHIMGDYGIAINARTGAILTPATCPDQGATIPSSGRRHLQTEAEGIVNYEPWRLADTPLPLFGLVSGHVTINTTDPMTACVDDGCAALVATGWKGAKRFIHDSDTTDGGFHLENPGQTGEFYTDPMGMEILNAQDDHAVRQWIKPGWNGVSGSQLPGKCFDIYQDGRPYVCNSTQPYSPSYYGTLAAPN